VKEHTRKIAFPASGMKKWADTHGVLVGSAGVVSAGAGRFLIDFVVGRPVLDAPPFEAGSVGTEGGTSVGGAGVWSQPIRPIANTATAEKPMSTNFLFEVINRLLLRFVAGAVGGKNANVREHCGPASIEARSRGGNEFAATRNYTINPARTIRLRGIEE
jgi:hypothetical protein